MSRTVLSVENLGKEYVIGGRQNGGDSFREMVVSAAAAPFRALRCFRGTVIPEEFTWALKDVNLEVKEGEVVGLIGRNGAGKSTLLKILSRITAPTEGRATIRGRVASLLEVGTGFHHELTGRENVYLNGAILGMSRAEIRQKFDAIVAFAEIDRFIDTPVKRYSSGMYVRLAFAVAAHLETEILLVDEVLAVGDASFQEKCLGKMNSISRQEGRTVLLVSHNMPTIQHICSRTILMREGRLAADACPSVVIASYLSEFRNLRNVDVSAWKDRKTTGEAQIVGFEIGEDGSNSLPFGTPLRFRIHAVFAEELVDPAFGLVIHDTFGNPIVNLNSLHSGTRVGKVSGPVVIEGSIPSISLYPGEYLLSPWITDGAYRRDIDCPRMCAQLHVVPAPGAFGDMKLDPNWGKVFLPSQWVRLAAPTNTASLTRCET